jgi:hypothetical protein
MARAQQIYGGVRDDFGFREGEDPIRGFTAEEAVLWSKSDDHNYRLGVMQQRDERRLKEQGERERQAWTTTRAGQLLKKLGESFAEYKECLEHDPRLQAKAQEFDEMNQKIFNRIKTNIERAHNAPRCRFEKANGTMCRAPRVRGKKLCHMHLMMEEARPEKIRLPGLSDANAIQAAIAKGAQALVDGKLEQKQASILGYYLQLALSNVGRVNFEEERGVEQV